MGCDSNSSIVSDTDTNTDISSDTESISRDVLLIGEGAQSYVIVRPDILNEKETEAVNLIASHFQKSGTIPTIVTVQGRSHRVP